MTFKKVGIITKTFAEPFKCNIAGDECDLCYLGIAFNIIDPAFNDLIIRHIIKISNNCQCFPPGSGQLLYIQYCYSEERKKRQGDSNRSNGRQAQHRTLPHVAYGTFQKITGTQCHQGRPVNPAGPRN